MAPKKKSKRSLTSRAPVAEAATQGSRATSYDVALRAGISQSAVSRCFQEGASISPKMRARVMRAAEDLGYTPNAIARSLITRRSNLIAVIISNLTNLYYPEVLAELSALASAKGIRVLLFTLSSESEIDHVLEQVWQYRVDGAISAARLSSAQIDTFSKNGVPLVLYNRYLQGSAASAVFCDQSDGARVLVERLVSVGHRRFGVIAGPRDSFVGQERVAASLQQLAKLGFHNVPVVAGEYDYESGVRGLHELVSAAKRYLQAVICANDVMAIGAMDAARFDLGIAVPDKLSVVGFDGVGPASWSSYRLTTLRQPVQRMAEATLSLLLDRISNPSLPAERRVFSGTLIEGSSAKLGPT
ncbi:MAG: LacI family transcriptional regulator [Gammaproteobacteria bacterium]|nr:LacI family transcriptional regulator [Gammaproteobacteria bacterium]